MDHNDKGYIDIEDLVRVFKELGVETSYEEAHEMI